MAFKATHVGALACGMFTWSLEFAFRRDFGPSRVAGCVGSRLGRGLIYE